MKVLVIGSGGREHAIAWKLRQSPSVSGVFCAPGNAGIETVAETVPLKADDLKGLVQFAKKQEIGLTVVGPEQPLVAGIVDLFEAHGLPVFGPSRSAAQLEGSKAFAKEFMVRHQIPTARYQSFVASQAAEAERFIRSLSLPVVVKADGLAAGKGVVICETAELAVKTLREILEDKLFGKAGERVVIEEFLRGEEASMFALSDGNKFLTLASAQDHKRILDGDQGKNTGGMGAYAPAPIITSDLRSRVIDEIIRPTIEGMKADGIPYRGCLYVGLMMTNEGPKVLEYNCRFGDPEAQVVIPLIEGDFAQLLLTAAQGDVKFHQVDHHPASAVCVVMASRGYPDEYETGKPIHGLDSVDAHKGEIVFHAGTRRERANVVTAGGRVLGVTAIGISDDLEGTIRSAYRVVERIAFDGAYYRSDIGQKALTRLKTARAAGVKT